MQPRWIPLQPTAKAPSGALADEGVRAHVNDPTFWQEALAEFGVEATLSTPLDADLWMMAQDEGVIVRGRLSGALTFACDRCAAHVEHTVDATFDLFEVPAGDDEDAEGPELVRGEPDNFEVDVHALAWEQFALTVPPKVLCKSACKGLCPVCGLDLNTDTCACETDSGDLRMAVFRSLKVDRKH